MRHRCIPLLAMLLVLLERTGPRCAYGQIGKALARGAERNIAKSAERSWFSILRRDSLRDRTVRPGRLLSNRPVFHYTSKAQARLESHTGIAKGSHLTSRSDAGRPLSGVLAQRRFGLPAVPSVRERVVLKKGTAVRLNKALGGKPGYGEIRLAQRVRPENIRNVVPLRRVPSHSVTRRKDHP